MKTQTIKELNNEFIILLSLKSYYISIKIIRMEDLNQESH